MLKKITTIVNAVDKISNIFKIVGVLQKTTESFKEHYFEAFPDQKKIDIKI